MIDIKNKMTTLKSKSTGTKHKSAAHSLSESGSDLEASFHMASNQPLIQSSSSEQSKGKKKKSKKNPSDQDNGCIITGETIVLDDTTPVHLGVNLKSSRKRRRTEEVAGSQSDCEITGETNVPLQENSPAPKPPKSKKRKVQKDQSSSAGEPAARVPPPSGPGVSAGEPVAGPSGANVQSSVPGTSSNDTSATVGDTDGPERTYFINPDEASLLYENIASDDEIWVIQCPKFINPELLVGNSVNFHRKSTVKCKKLDGSNVELDSYPVNTDAESSKINLLLPSEEEIFKIKVADLQGKLILTEQVTVPEIDYDALLNTQQEVVTFPSNLKVRHPLLGLDIPKGPSVSLKQQRRKADKLNVSSNINPTIATYDLQPSRDSFTNLSSSTKPWGATDYISLLEDHANETQTNLEAQGNENIGKSKKKKRKHAEESLDDVEVKTEWFFNDSVNPRPSLGENCELLAKDNAGDFLNPPTDQLFGTVNVEGNSPSRSKKKKKRHKEVIGNDADDLPMELKDEPIDSVELIENHVEESPVRSKKKKKNRNDVVSNEMDGLPFDLKDEPRDLLEAQENMVEEPSSKSKKKKKRHSENIPNGSEDVDPEFKREPFDPMDVGQNHSAGAISTSKKKKKKHRDLEFIETDIKTEPVDPLALDMDPEVDESHSSSKKKRRNHEGIRLNDSTVLPVVFKSEWDSQESSFEQDDTMSHRPKKKNKKHRKTVEDDEVPIIVDENHDEGSFTDLNCNQNDVSNHRIEKKKKKHSAASADITEISCGHVEFPDEPVVQSLTSSGKSKKKKRKSGLDTSIDECEDSRSIKIEPMEPIESEVESKFSLFGAVNMNFRPSFMDTLSNNFEFSVSDSSKSKSKKKHS